MSTALQYLVGFPKPCQTDPGFGRRTAWRLIQTPDQIILSAEMYDREEHRQYDYEGIFSMDDYVHALNTLNNKQSEAEAFILGCDGSQLQLCRQGVQVTLKLTCSTTGTSSLSGAICQFTVQSLSLITPRA